MDEQSSGQYSIQEKLNSWKWYLFSTIVGVYR